MNNPMLPERPAATAIRADFLADEGRVVARLLPLASSDAAASARISARARGWVEAVRARQAGSAGIDQAIVVQRREVLDCVGSQRKRH